MSTGVCAAGMSSIMDSIASAEALSRHFLASRASAVLELWLSTALVILVAEKQAWAMAVPNLFASRPTLALWDDEVGDLSTELCLEQDSWDLCGFFFSELSSMATCLLFLGVSPWSHLCPLTQFHLPRVEETWPSGCLTGQPYPTSPEGQGL